MRIAQNDEMMLRLGLPALGSALRASATAGGASGSKNPRPSKPVKRRHPKGKTSPPHPNFDMVLRVRNAVDYAEVADPKPSKLPRLGEPAKSAAQLSGAAAAGLGTTLDNLDSKYEKDPEARKRAIESEVRPKPVPRFPGVFSKESRESTHSCALSLAYLTRFPIFSHPRSIVSQVLFHTDTPEWIEEQNNNLWKTLAEKRLARRVAKANAAAAAIERRENEADELVAVRTTQSAPPFASDEAKICRACPANPPPHTEPVRGKATRAEKGVWYVPSSSSLDDFSSPILFSCLRGDFAHADYSRFARPRAVEQEGPE